MLFYLLSAKSSGYVLIVFTLLEVWESVASWLTKLATEIGQSRELYVGGPVWMLSCLWW